MYLLVFEKSANMLGRPTDDDAERCSPLPLPPIWAGAARLEQEYIYIFCLWSLHSNLSMSRYVRSCAVTFFIVLPNAVSIYYKKRERQRERHANIGECARWWQLIARDDL